MGSALNRCGGKLITVEDHQLIGGLGAIAAQSLMQAKIEFKGQFLGVKEEFGRSAYNAIELYQAHGIDAKAIVDRVQSML